MLIFIYLVTISILFWVAEMYIRLAQPVTRVHFSEVLKVLKISKIQEGNESLNI